MPAGPEQQSQADSWHDYPSFREHILSECERLNCPRPTDQQLENEYIYRQVAKARAASHAEVAVWEANAGRTERGVRTR